MNRIDGSDHYEVSATGQTPSLLTLIIDTNPRAWHALGSALPISKAIANILVFVNAHLAFGNDNQVAILAAHSHRAVWLYPQPPPPKRRPGGRGPAADGDDVEMTGTATNGDRRGAHARPPAGGGRGSANKYPQFASIESTVLAALSTLIEATPAADLPPTTLVAGALTMALAHIHKTAQAFAPPKPAADAANPSTAAAAHALAGAADDHPTLHARILVVSVSDSEPAQYIATMNAVFAAAHARIPIDTLSLSPYASPTFLQQAAFITGGSYLSAATPPPAPRLSSASDPPTAAAAAAAAPPSPPDLTRVRGLLTYLFFALLPDAAARAHLVRPTQHGIDFRAACFCHRRVVDTGFVCSVCLSIFCAAPPDAECLTCGTKLALGHYGARPQLVPRRKKKKKKATGAVSAATSAAPGGSREATGSATGTPGP